MRLLLCGGGTAGHINPAIAVAEEIKKQNPDAQILFIGREGGRENEIIKNSGLELQTIKIQGIKRSLNPENIKSVILAIRAIAKAKKIIKRFKPDVILGTGGYVCWPVITAGKSLGIPSAIHESNISPGLTTKLLAKKSDIVFLNRKETENYLPKGTKTLAVGNPLRQGFAKVSRNEAREKLKIKENETLIVSFGGSIGAEKMNEVILRIIENYSSKKDGVKHIHATGKRYYDKTRDYNKFERFGCKIIPFINNMAETLMAADIVISRSGAMTLSELSEVGVSAILVPSPNVTDNHQFINAKYLFDLGAADLITEENLTEETLKRAIERLKIDKNGRKKRAKNIKALSTPKSAKLIAKELILLKSGIKRTV